MKEWLGIYLSAIYGFSNVIVLIIEEPISHFLILASKHLQKCLATMKEDILVPKSISWRMKQFHKTN